MTTALIAAAGFLAAAVAQGAGGLIVLIRFDDKPAPRVEVRVGERRATTGANGEAAFDVPPGTHTVVVESPAHLPVSTTATVVEGPPTRFSRML